MTELDWKLYARVQFEAARKNLDDCREREREARIEYMDAMDATLNAIFRIESLANLQWKQR